MKTIHTISLLSITCGVLFLLSSCVSNTKEELPPLTASELRAMRFLGAELTPEQNIALGKIVIHRREKEISFPAIVNMSQGDLEVLICTPRGRTHESLLLTEIDPFNLQLALILSGAHNGSNTGIGKIPQGTLFDIYLEPKNGKRVPIEKWMYNKTKMAPRERLGWVFIGSSFASNNICLASKEGNIVNINSRDQNTILDTPLTREHFNEMFTVYEDNIPDLEFDKSDTDQWIAHVRVYLSVRKQ